MFIKYFHLPTIKQKLIHSQRDALSYILRCLHTLPSTVIQVRKESDGHLALEKDIIRTIAEDDNVSCGTIDKQFHPISDIWYHKITAENENALVDKTFRNLTVCDVVFLKPGHHVDDSILVVCRRALMAYNDRVGFVDPTLVERFFMRGFKDLRTTKRQMSIHKDKDLI